MKKLFVILLILLLIPVASAGLVDDIKAKIIGEHSGYECNVDVDSDKRDRPECAKDSHRMHACQIKGDFDGQGVPDFCNDFCLKRSKMDPSCVTVTVTKSAFTEDDVDYIAQDIANNNDKKSILDYLKGDKDSDEDEWTDEDDAQWEEYLENTNPLESMKPGDSKVHTDGDGNTVGILVAPNGAVSYSTDGKSFFPTKEDALNPPFTKSISNAFNSFMGIFSNQKKGEKGQMQKVADQLMNELKNSDELKGSAVQFAAGTQAGALAKGATSIGAVSALKGPVAMGIGVPGTAISILAKGATREAISTDIVNYISRREDSSDNSIADIKDDFTFSRSTDDLFDQDESKTYEGFELAYKRYCLKKKLEGSSCRGG